MSNHVRNFGGDIYADAGVWSPPTSAANFCEEDYAITIYIAEFINTLSNLTYVYLALYYPKSRIRDVDLMSASLIMVGVSSFLYHATLRQTLQFSDDLSMLVLAGTLIHRLYCYQKSRAQVALTTVVLSASVCAMSAYYIQSRDVLVHTYMFAGMLTLIWPRTLYLIYSRSRSTDEKSNHFRKFKIAVVSLILAFALWNIDLNFCMQLRELRKTIGLPWAWLLELHGWWHILTAVGAAVYMDLVRGLCI